MEKGNKMNAFIAIDEAQEFLSRISKITDGRPEHTTIKAGRVHFINEGVSVDYFFPLSEQGEMIMTQLDKRLIADQRGMSKKDTSKSIAHYKVRIGPQKLNTALNAAEAALSAENMVDAETILGSAAQDLFILQEILDLKKHP